MTHDEFRRLHSDAPAASCLATVEMLPWHWQFNDAGRLVRVMSVSCPECDQVYELVCLKITGVYSLSTAVPDRRNRS